MLTREDILKIPRTKVRYQLYRIRTAEEGGSSYEAEAEVFKEFFEKQRGFRGWNNFARIWDIDEQGKHDKVVRRAMTEGEEWTSQLELLMEDLPVGRESNL